MRTGFPLTLALTAILAVPALAQAPSAQPGSGPGAAPPAGTGRQESGAAVSGTAGHRGSEVVNRQDFVRLAFSNAMFETETARLALERSRDEAQRRFAQDMLDSHAKSTEELRGVLRGHANLRGIQPPERMAEQYQTWMTQLRAAQGDKFQPLYAQQQAQAHLIALDLFRNYAQTGDDEALKRWAASQLPILQKHFEATQGLKGRAS